MHFNVFQPIQKENRLKEGQITVVNFIKVSLKNDIDIDDDIEMYSAYNEGLKDLQLLKVLLEL